jgi:hypothetical protein
MNKGIAMAAVRQTFGAADNTLAPMAMSGITAISDDLGTTTSRRVLNGGTNWTKPAKFTIPTAMWTIMDTSYQSCTAGEFDSRVE